MSLTCNIYLDCNNPDYSTFVPLDTVNVRLSLHVLVSVQIFKSSTSLLNSVENTGITFCNDIQTFQWLLKLSHSLLNVMLTLKTKLYLMWVGCVKISSHNKVNICATTDQANQISASLVNDFCLVQKQTSSTVQYCNIAIVSYSFMMLENGCHGSAVFLLVVRVKVC